MSELIHTLFSVYIPEVPLNVVVRLLAYKADFKFQDNFSFWS